MQWIVEPTGMLRIGRVLPARIGASAPDSSVAPASRPRDVGGAVRVVFDAFDLGRDAVLVAHEVDNAVVVLGTAATMTDRDVTVVVAAGLLELGFQQGSVRSTLEQVVTRDLHRAALARRSGFHLDDGHD